MALIDEVKAVCDRLAPLGWRDLLLAASRNACDISQATNAKLKAALQAPVSVDDSLRGFEDFEAMGACGIVAGQPARSLLYHALASPRVVRDAGGKLLRDFPTVREIETVENFVFGIVPSTLAAIRKAAGADELRVIVYATEYRPASDCPDGPHAGPTFSRTGIARVGTARPKYLPDVRGCWPEDDDNPQAFRVVPVRFAAWLAAPVTGDVARVMRLRSPGAAEKKRVFWIPVHKLFDGPECIDGLDLSLQCSARFFNLKLQKVQQSLSKEKPPTGFPYVIEDGLAELVERSEFGSIAVVPTVHESLVEPAKRDGALVTYEVPKGKSAGFGTYSTPSPTRAGLDAEIHRYPAYVHARTRVIEGRLIDLNESEDVDGAVSAGNYDALLYVDWTGEGWVEVTVPELRGKPGVAADSSAAYVLLSAPDFFPSCGQRELGRWALSQEIPGSFRPKGQIWGVSPEALSGTRLPANLQLPDSPFDAKEDTMTAVVGMGRGGAPPTDRSFADVVRASTLPDDAAGVFAPGWDVSVDVKGTAATGIPHLAAYGLGSPFPEDAKLCAALSTFWPAVAPDVYRTMSPHSGTADFRGTVAPLTDEEIGQVGTLPWDGTPGPIVVRDEGRDWVEMARFISVDYVHNAVENRFSNRLTARITSEEYQRRVLAASRVHWILSGGVDVTPTRTQWLLLSFRTVSTGDPELQTAQRQGGHVLDGVVYRVEACFVGEGDPTVSSPKGPRFRRLPLRRHNLFFVAAGESIALRRRSIDQRWARAVSE
jgi:hypothetical protein